MVDAVYAKSSALIATTIVGPVVTQPTFGRLQICELLDIFVAAHNKDNTASGFYIITGTLGRFANPLAINSYFGTSTLSNSNSIFVFDLYYKCGSTAALSYIALVFA